MKTEQSQTKQQYCVSKWKARKRKPHDSVSLHPLLPQAVISASLWTSASFFPLYKSAFFAVSCTEQPINPTVHTYML